MKALRNFKGIKKGQAVPEGKFSDDEMAVYIKYGFVAKDKPKKKAKKAESK
jgi:hypothetical protein